VSLGESQAEQWYSPLPINPHGPLGTVGAMVSYVDVARSYPDAGLRHTEYCHLLADTRDELHAMAERLGLPRRIFQDHPWRWHYDLPAHLRARAIALGAVPVSMHQVGALLAARRSAARSIP
jgi:Protein of unknown function (DUF4031)